MRQDKVLELLGELIALTTPPHTKRCPVTKGRTPYYPPTCLCKQGELRDRLMRLLEDAEERY